MLKTTEQTYTKYFKGEVVILYFSATGNCEYIAKSIACKLGDSAVSITEIKDGIFVKEGERLGIVCPTYFWGLPSYVENFIKNLNISFGGKNYVFFIATYGTTSGQADFYMKKILNRKKVELSASFGIKTVDNWTVAFSVKDKQKIKEILIEEEKQIEKVISSIDQKKKEYISKDKKSRFLCQGARVAYNSARKTKNFSVGEECVTCGLCERECPEQAIKIHEGKPKWIKERCTLCFRCIHRCPKFAIEYKNKTKRNGQYCHPKFK